MSCGKGIAWFDLVPVVSWIALRGRCRHCGVRISFQYPIVEFLTGVLFASIALARAQDLLSAPVHTLFILFIDCVIASLLIMIAIYDLRHTIIPDEWVYSFGALALVSAFFSVHTPAEVIVVLLSGPCVAAPLYAIWLFSGGRAMGLGDAKLALGIGWLLGSVSGIFAILGGFVLGAIISIPLLVFSSQWWRDIVARFTPRGTFLKSIGGFTMKSEVPFGPFLIASAVGYWVLSLYGVTLNIFS